LNTIRLVEVDLYGNYVWEAEQSEYDKIYKKDEFANFINKQLNPTIALLQVDDDGLYKLILNKYEYTFLSIYNTFNECIQINGKVSDEINFKTIKLLQKFINALNVHKHHLDSLAQVEAKAINKSFEERLDFELDYQDKFLENYSQIKPSQNIESDESSHKETLQKNTNISSSKINDELYKDIFSLSKKF
jgi:hypothetical protein